MERTKSSLTSFTKLSPNCTKPRTEKISRLTPHCVAGNLTIESILGLSRFVNSDPVNGASCNYAIGSDGRKGLGVEEKNRSWCTSSRTNDMQAITFEIANDGEGPDWHMSEKAINGWLDLAVDIAKFYNFKQVAYRIKPNDIANDEVEDWIDTWSPPNTMIITLHNWFKNKACPGPYFTRQLPWLTNEINRRLSGVTPEKFVGENSTPILTPTSIKTFQPYTITINVPAVNIRKGPGTNHSIVKTLFNDKNVYTVTEEANGTGANKWCKLKSGIGWISKDCVNRK